MKKIWGTASAFAMVLAMTACNGIASDSREVQAVETSGQSQVTAVSEQSQATAKPENVQEAEKWNREKEKTVKENGCVFHAYLSKDEKESWIYQIEIEKSGLKKMVFPKTVQGAPVTRLACGEELYEEDADWYYDIFHNSLEPWHGCYDTIEKARKIETIEFPSTVTRIEAGAFCGWKKLKKVTIPAGVSKLGVYTFAACTSLKKVVFPENLQSFEPFAFKKSNKIADISISKKSRYQTKKGLLIEKAGKKVLWVAPSKKKVVFPSGIKSLGEDLFLSSAVTNVEIPKTVTKIERRALSGKNIGKVVLKKGNSTFAKDGGTIYAKKDRRLVAVLVQKGKVKISSKVKILGEGTSVMGKGIKRVDIPKSIKRVIEDWMFFDYLGSSKALIYFHGTKPPVIQSKYKGGEYTALPIFDQIYVPKKAKKAYIQWAADRDGLKWEHLHTF